MNDGILRSDDGRIYLPDIQDIRTEVVRAMHESGIGGHRNPAETLRALRRVFIFEDMAGVVAKVSTVCLACARNKTDTARKPPPLARRVPGLPFSVLHMDEASGLPPVKGMDAAWVVVDRLTGFTFSFPLPTPCDARTLARLLVERVFSIVGVPFTIVSDADSR